MARQQSGDGGWKRTLEELFEAVEAPGRAAPADPPRVKRFIAEVVVPAFEEVARELQKHGRDVEVKFGDRKAQIQVLHDGEEEFFYAVEANPYRKRDVAFPLVPLRDAEGRTYRAEARLRNRPLHEDVTDLTREEIIESFLREYGRRLRWDL
jgi:choline/glycine/proline betaine transport protein